MNLEPQACWEFNLRPEVREMGSLGVKLGVTERHGTFICSAILFILKMS